MSGGTGDVEALLRQMGWGRDAGDRPLTQRLEELVDAAAEALDGTSVGVMVFDEEGILRVLGATDDVAAALEQAQLDAREGPGWVAGHEGVVACSHDVHHDDRWPRLGRAIGATPLVAMLCAPIPVHDETVGTFNVMSRHVRSWSAADRRTIEAFASLAGLVLVIGARRESRQLLADVASLLNGDPERPDGEG